MVTDAHLLPPPPKATLCRTRLCCSHPALRLRLASKVRAWHAMYVLYMGPGAASCKQLAWGFEAAVCENAG